MSSDQDGDYRCAECDETFGEFLGEDPCWKAYGKKLRPICPDCWEG